MQDNVAEDGDRIEGLGAEIGKDAADVGRTRAAELGKEAEIAHIDGEIDALSKRREALRAERAALHEREIADEREIARDVELLAG